MALIVKPATCVNAQKYFPDDAISIINSGDALGWRLVKILQVCLSAPRNGQPSQLNFISCRAFLRICLRLLGSSWQRSPKTHLYIEVPCDIKRVYVNNCPKLLRSSSSLQPRGWMMRAMQTTVKSAFRPIAARFLMLAMETSKEPTWGLPDGGGGLHN